MNSTHSARAGRIQLLLVGGTVLLASSLLVAVPPEPPHWAFQPISDPQPPNVQARDWCRSPIDFFVLAELEARGLEPSRRADRRALIRRAAFDLLGLPPAASEIETFLRDTSAGAYDRVVDRLLASPRYGERWGRHWLDVARYSDTKGYVFTAERRFPFSYTYRDYVIRAFNEDLPFDRFILEQLAADQLELGADKRSLAAMGFLTLGRRFLNNVHDIVDDRIDVVTRGLLGLTVQCARCHDHKYDPIPMADYYSLYGVFANSVEPKEGPLIGEPEDAEAYAKYRAALDREQGAVDKLRAQKHRELLSELRSRTADYLLAAARRDGGVDPEIGVSLGAGELRPRVVRRWQQYLQKRSGPEDPVFAPWHAFISLKPAAFESEAAALCERWKEQGRLNEKVLAAFRPPPVGLEDVAKRYGRLFGEVAELSEPAADAPIEELRRVLHGEDSPLHIPLAQAGRLFDRATRNRLRSLQKKVDRLRATDPGAPPRAMALVDRRPLVEPRVFLRGKPSRPGESVPRQFLAVLSRGDREPFRKGSGRLELAEAIADAENPLTARVIVNRVWLHHFGHGLVRTPSDFGRRSEPPTHLALLDFLSRRLVESGWSIKHLHRLIVLSSVYQQASDIRPRHYELDPENRLLWRMNRRRLEFEPMRDAVLAVADRLDTRMGGRSVDIRGRPFSTRRTVYGFVDRQNLPGLLRAFDFASPDSTCPQRHRTTVPQQALFLMNSPFVIDHARHLANHPELRAATSREERIRRLYRRVYGRAPDEDELALGLRFLREQKEGSELDVWVEYAQILLLANEFAYVD